MNLQNIKAIYRIARLDREDILYVPVQGEEPPVLNWPGRSLCNFIWMVNFFLTKASLSYEGKQFLLITVLPNGEEEACLPAADFTWEVNHDCYSWIWRKTTKHFTDWKMETGGKGLCLTWDQEASSSESLFRKCPVSWNFITWHNLFKFQLSDAIFWVSGHALFRDGASCCRKKVLP